MKCSCGSPLHDKEIDIPKIYRDEAILVQKVPIYECEKNHILITRNTHSIIKKRLALAHEKGLDTIDF